MLPGWGVGGAAEGLGELLCLRSRSSSCNVSPLVRVLWWNEVPAEPGRAQRVSKPSRGRSPGSDAGERQLHLGMSLPDPLLFEGPYSGWRAGIVAAAVTVAVALLAVVILVTYCSSTGELQTGAGRRGDPASGRSHRQRLSSQGAAAAGAGGAARGSRPLPSLTGAAVSLPGWKTFRLPAAEATNPGRASASPRALPSLLFPGRSSLVPFKREITPLHGLAPDHSPARGTPTPPPAPSPRSGRWANRRHGPRLKPGSPSVSCWKASCQPTTRQPRAQP